MLVQRQGCAHGRTGEWSPACTTVVAQPPPLLPPTDRPPSPPAPAVTAALFELIFGAQPGGGALSVILQAEGGAAGVAAVALPGPAAGSGGYLVQGEAVQQLFARLGAEVADVVSFRRSGSTPQGSPVALASVAEKAAGATLEATAAAAAAAAASSPLSPDALLAAGVAAQQQQQQQQQQPGATPAAAAEEPSAPATVRGSDALALAAAAGVTPGRLSLDAAEAAAVMHGREAVSIGLCCCCCCFAGAAAAACPPPSRLDSSPARRAVASGSGRGAGGGGRGGR